MKPGEWKLEGEPVGFTLAIRSSIGIGAYSKLLETVSFLVLLGVMILVAVVQYQVVLAGEVHGAPATAFALLWPLLAVVALAWFTVLTADDVHWMFRGRTVLELRDGYVRLSYPGSRMVKAQMLPACDLAMVSVEPGWWASDYQWFFRYTLLRRAAQRGPLGVAYGLPPGSDRAGVRMLDLGNDFDEIVGSARVVRFGGTLPIATAVDIRDALRERLQCVGNCEPPNKRINLTR